MTRKKYADCPSCHGEYPSSCAHQEIHERIRERGAPRRENLPRTIEVQIATLLSEDKRKSDDDRRSGT